MDWGHVRNQYLVDRETCGFWGREQSIIDGVHDKSGLWGKSIFTALVCGKWTVSPSWISMAVRNYFRFLAELN